MGQNLTGYPSIDKPWTKYYRENPIREINEEQTIYEMVFESNKNNMNAPAVKYMGKVWNFRKLKKQTDKAAEAFANAGVKIGDTVLIGVANCPEVLVILLALNKIGAVSKWFDIRAGEKDIEEYIITGNCRYLIVFDLLLPKINVLVDKVKIEKILVIYPTDSLSKPIQMAYSFKANRLPVDSRYIRFKEFVKKGNANQNIACVTFDKEKPSIMIQSSGTTGKPKIIVHSDFSATTYAKKIAYSDLPMGLGRTALVVLPPWIAYALGDAMLAPLAMGTTVLISPTIEPDSIVKYLGQFTMALTAPVCYRYLKDNISSLTKRQQKGMQKIEVLVSGGDKITVEENAEFEKIFKTTFVNGYGNNEGWGCLTVNPVLHNKYGTVGIPKCGEVIIAYDNDSKKELSYGQVGEICILTNTMLLYYEGNQEETKEVKKIHEDGKVWIHTGDLGFIDQEGFVTLCGRMRRVIVRSAFKISAYTIEDKICEHPAVKECVAVEVKDEKEEHVPMAYIVLKKNVGKEDDVKKSIIEKCSNELKEYEVPKYFRIVESLPYTQNGKYDFRMLETLGNEFVDNQEE